MSGSVQPPPPMPLPPTVTAPSPTVTLPNLPDVLAQLPKGSIVEAQVVNGLDNGNVRLQVAVADTVLSVEAKLPVAMPSGTNLSLRVQQVGQAGDVASLRLSAVNGRPLALAGLAHADAGAGAKAALQTGMQSAQMAQAVKGIGVSGQGAATTATGAEGLGATSTIGVGKPISALVLRNDLMKSDADKTDVMNTGTRLTVRLTRIAMPEVGAGGNRVTPGNAGGQGFGMATTQAGQSAGAGQTVSGGAASLGPAGMAAAGGSGQGPNVVPGQAAARYAASGQFANGATAPVTSGQGGNVSGPVGALPGGTGGQASASPSGLVSATTGSNPAAGSAQTVLSSMNGTVVGHSAVGQPTIQTPTAMVALDVRAPLPAGTQVSFDVLTATPPQPGASAAVLGGGYAATAQANPWTTLDALSQTLGHSNPQAAARLIAALPQPGPHLLANLVAAMSAVRTGDVQGWLKLSEDGRIDDKNAGRIKKLADRLTDDVREAGNSARRPAGDWRAYSLPFYANGEIEKIQMLVRRAPDKDDDEARQQQRERAKSDVRFLMDLNLSRLGDMQLDGLVNNVAKSFDLVIRTHDALPDVMPKEILGVFNGALSAVGYTGSLNFRVTSDFIVPEDVIAGTGNSTSGVEV